MACGIELLYFFFPGFVMHCCALNKFLLVFSGQEVHTLNICVTPFMYSCNYDSNHFISPQLPLLEAGDIIIDGGNSEYKDSTVSTIIATFSGLKLTCFLFNQLS